MAISPPSDLVLDVLRAADPVDVQAAQAKLKANRAAFAANSLAEAGAGFGAAMDTTAMKAGLGRIDKSAKMADMPEEYRKFEASVLQSFVNTMMPSDSENVYGKGSAGEFWKSMMSEQIADRMSQTGGIGIAEQMYAQALDRLDSKKALNAETDENARARATGAIEDFQRRTLKTEEMKREGA
ncbi:Rod binding domain-containing protein [Neorhizobium huautlense]|uniref:Rod binding domain-containing protein n=1 Tax=Neorhizobium huautlense TaxID=67774 RepID=A0ABT9PTF4_9HYPH|nr:rod-binding protein [Neorhizobium huautlense]MDP9837745.1 Rod binding domain-containing protein [Neorhizobium huautlense]